MPLAPHRSTHRVTMTGRSHFFAGPFRPCAACPRVHTQTSVSRRIGGVCGRSAALQNGIEPDLSASRKICGQQIDAGVCRHETYNQRVGEEGLRWRQMERGEQAFNGNAAAGAGEPRRVGSASVRNTHLHACGAATSAFRIDKKDSRHPPVPCYRYCCCRRQSPPLSLRPRPPPLPPLRPCCCYCLNHHRCRCRCAAEAAA